MENRDVTVVTWSSSRYVASLGLVSWLIYTALTVVNKLVVDYICVTFDFNEDNKQSGQEGKVLTNVQMWLPMSASM